MSVKVYLTQEIRDSHGKRLFYKKRRSHSFTLQFLDHIAILFNHDYGVASAGESVTDTSNTARTLTATTGNTYHWMACEAPGGTVTYGIVCGTGTNAEAVTNYALQTQIAEGAGAGQFNHGACAVTGAIAAGAITSFTIIRAMANNSGGQITVQEVGVYVTSKDATLQRYFCILRDLTGAVPVGDGQTYTVTYTIETSI